MRIDLACAVLHEIPRSAPQTRVPYMPKRTVFYEVELPVGMAPSG